MQNLLKKVSVSKTANFKNHGFSIDLDTIKAKKKKENRFLKTEKCAKCVQVSRNKQAFFKWLVFQIIHNFLEFFDKTMKDNYFF